jgi:glycosyltransferase involved in cell wall biosynthesis
MRSSKPQYSVVIPLFNKREYVENAVRSVLSQDYSDFELLVVDDGSTDGGAERLNARVHDERIRIIRKENSGEGAARNCGLREARGRIIAFLDADDEWMPTHLSDLDAAAQRFPAAGILATRFAYKQGDAVIVDNTICSDVPLLFTNYFRLATRRAFVINSSSCAIRRDVFVTVGGFLEATALGADQEYWARIGIHYSLGYHPTVSALYHLGVPGSAMTVSPWKPDPPPLVVTLKKYLALSQSADHLRDDIRNYVAWILLNQAANGIKRGAGREVRQILQDPLLSGCHFPNRLMILRVLSLLPRSVSTAVFRAHLKPWASAWRDLYAKATHPGFAQELRPDSRII